MSGFHFVLFFTCGPVCMYALFFLPLVPTLGLFFAGWPFEAEVFLSTAEVFLCCGELLLPTLFILFLWCLGMASGGPCAMSVCRSQSFGREVASGEGTRRAALLARPRGRLWLGRQEEARRAMDRCSLQWMLTEASGWA